MGNFKPISFHLDVIKVNTEKNKNGEPSNDTDKAGKQEILEVFLKINTN